MGVKCSWTDFEEGQVCAFKSEKLSGSQNWNGKWIQERNSILLEKIPDSYDQKKSSGWPPILEYQVMAGDEVC